MSADITVRCHACGQQIGTADDRSDVLAIQAKHSNKMDDESHEGTWWLTVESSRPRLTVRPFLFPTPVSRTPTIPRLHPQIHIHRRQYDTRHTRHRTHGQHNRSWGHDCRQQENLHQERRVLWPPAGGHRYHRRQAQRVPGATSGKSVTPLMSRRLIRVQ